MKLNLEKTFTAPFTSMGDTSLLHTYLIAGGITLAAVVIMFVFQFGLQIITSVLTIAGGDTGGVVAGIASCFISVILIIVSVACMALPWGYILETIKLEIYDRSSIMPSWQGNFGRFFWNGVKVQIVWFVYGFLIALLCAIPILITVAAAMLASHQSTDIGALAGSIGGLICLIVCGIIVLVYIIMVPMVIVTYAAESSFGKAFNIFHIWAKILNNALEYLLALVITIVFGIAAGMVASLLCCTVVGVLVFPLLSYFICPIIIMNMFAQLYKD